MRVLFWLALLANLLFFSYMQWGSSLLRGDAGLLSQPALHPEKIQLLPAAASSVTAVPAHTPPASAPTPPPATAPAACMEWGEFSGDDLKRTTAALAALNLGDTLSQREVEYNIGYWVYMPPQRNLVRAEKKASELKAFGVNDYYIVREAGKWQYAISLGVFKTEEAAQNYLAELRQHKVRSAVVGQRQSKLKFTVFVFRNPDPALTAKVVALQKEFPDSELKAAACN